MRKPPISHRSVDVEAGDRLVDWLQQTNSNKGPHHQQIVEGIGGFASLFGGLPIITKTLFGHLYGWSGD
ncbi:MAG: hypothetical protein IPK04_22085 [Bdellovibrionales bacterium]|nr:hypothetical protein [Bdellovibrionales bacterium]